MDDDEHKRIVNVVRVSARDAPANVASRIFKLFEKIRFEQIQDDILNIKLKRAPLQATVGVDESLRDEEQDKIMKIEVVGIGSAIPTLIAAVNGVTNSFAQVSSVRTSLSGYGLPMLSVSLEMSRFTSRPDQLPRLPMALRRVVSGPAGSENQNFGRPAVLRRARTSSFDAVNNTRSLLSSDMKTSADLKMHLLTTGTVPISSKAIERLTSFQGLSPTHTADGVAVQRFGEEEPTFELQASEKDICGICFESGKTLIRLCAVDDMGAKCGGFCTECVKSYAEQCVRDALHFCPWLRCPTCRRRVPTRVWSEHVDESVLSKYTQNAHSLLSVRCQECDEGHTLLPDAAICAPHTSDDFVFKDLDAESLDALRKAWAKFSRAEEPVDVLVEAIDKHYGADGTKKLTKQRRGGGDILKLVQDIERRLSLLLAWLRRHPQIRTSCCGAKVCFKCKVAGWHPGVSCEQKQQKLYMGASTAVQPCPGCGILTQRLEGCSEISCVCGEKWEWEEGDGSEIAQNSRPLLCLASRCPGARHIVRLLLEHAADANEHGQFGHAPLIYAARAFETDIVKELILGRANPNANRSSSGNRENDESGTSGLSATALSVALRGLRTSKVHEERFAQRIPTLKELVAAGADLAESAFDELNMLTNFRESLSLKDILQVPWQKAKAKGKAADSADSDDNLSLRVMWDTPASIEKALKQNGSSVGEEELAAVALRLLADSNAWSDCEDIANKLWACEKPDNDTWQELKTKAATNILCMELQSARQQERDADRTVVVATLHKKADPNCTQEKPGVDDEWCALHLLAANRQASRDNTGAILKHLLESRADINVESSYDGNPMQVAAAHNNITALELLLVSGAVFSESVEESFQLTIIHSCTVGFEDAVLTHGNTDRLPLWALVRGGHVEAVSLRLKSLARDSENKQRRKSNEHDKALDDKVELACGLKCENGHALRRSRHPHNTCDLCDRTGTAYRCSQGCDWDACHACFDFCRAEDETRVDPSAANDGNSTEAIQRLESDLETRNCNLDYLDEQSEANSVGSDAGSGLYGDEESMSSSGSTECWPIIVAACIRIQHLERRLKIEELLRDHLSDEKFDKMLKLARMHILHTEFGDAGYFDRTINEELVYELLAANVFCGAVEDEPCYKEGEYRWFEDQEEEDGKCTAAMRLIESLSDERGRSKEFMDAAHSVLKAILRTSGSHVNRRNSDGDNILDLVFQEWCSPQMYRTNIVAIVGTVVETGVEMNVRLLPLLKKLSVSKSSRELEAKIAPMVERTCEDAALIERLPLWLFLRFGLEKPSLEQLGAEDYVLPAEALADAAVGLLQLQLREADSDLPPICPATMARLEAAFEKRAGEDMSQQLRQVAWTTLLTLEIQEAATRQRPPDEEIVRNCLAKGANARALGNADGEPSDLEESDDDEDSEDEEEEDDDDDYFGDDYDGSSNSDGS